MKKLNTVVCLMMTIAFYGCTADKPKITLDLSDYKEADGNELSEWYDEQLIGIYKDASCTEEIKYQEDDNETSIDYYLDEDVEDVYVRLPILVRPVSIPEQTIQVKDGKTEDDNAYVKIDSISVGELGYENIFYPTSPYSIQIEIEDGESFPFTMYYHVNGETMETTYSYFDEERTKRYYDVGLEEEDTSLLKDAEITFDKLGQLTYITEDLITSEDVNIHFVE